MSQQNFNDFSSNEDAKEKLNYLLDKMIENKEWGGLTTKLEDGIVLIVKKDNTYKRISQKHKKT